MLSAKSFLSFGFIRLHLLRLPWEGKCRKRANHVFVIPFVLFGIRAGCGGALRQHGKLFPRGTSLVQFRKVPSSCGVPGGLLDCRLDTRTGCGLPKLGGFLLFLRVFLQVAVKARAPDSKHLRGAQAVSLAHIEDATDVYLAHFLQG